MKPTWILTLLIVVTLFVTACSAVAPPPPMTEEASRIANAMSAGPALIAEEATILDYGEGHPGNWPDEPAPAYVELRPGSNGWTCITDSPATPGNDPMCVNEVFFGVVEGRWALEDPSTDGVGIGYMLQGGGPVGTPPHVMVFSPGAQEDLTSLSTDVTPESWVGGWHMFPDTPYAHIMIEAPSIPDAVTADDDKLANAMSAGPALIAEEATILDYGEGHPGNWPDEPTPAYVELRPGSNGWTCITDSPATPGNDPMCVNETFFGVVSGRWALEGSPADGVGIGYMLQGGGPEGTPPHVMVFSPGAQADLTSLSTDVTPESWVGGWHMFPDTPYAHIMIEAP